VLFGATGDLAHKKIFPALHAMVKRGHLDVPIIGVAKSGWDIEALRAHVRENLATSGRLDAAFAKLSALLRYVDGDYRDPATWVALRAALGGAARPLHYLAIPPSMFPTVVEGLGKSEALRGARVVVEKPFGRDLASARSLNRTLHASPTPSWSRSGTGTTSRASRSPWPSASAWRDADGCMTRSARSAT
jgi:glucose-6-phosphate 1-dehydrogenase